MNLGDDVHVLAERLDAAVVTLAALTDFDDVEEDFSEHQTLGGGKRGLNISYSYVNTGSAKPSRK